MIADSTYDAGELIARPRTGILGGVVASVVMLAPLAVVTSRGQGGAVAAWLLPAGRTLFPTSLGSGHLLLLAGLLIHLSCGALFGAFHAASQQRTTIAGLLVVGVFYGFVLWLGTDIVLGRWLRVGPPALGTWVGVCAFVTYGLALGAWAACIQAATKRERSLRPVD